jgi:hypothetical protein
VGLGATVGTLQTGYPLVQASSQDKERGMQPRSVTCPAAPEPASQPRWALRLPCVQRLWSAPLIGRALEPPCVPWHRRATCPMASDPASLQGGLRATTRLVVPSGPWASIMKKGLVGWPVQQGSPVPNACMHVSKRLTSESSWVCKT